jgi:hypothetical protein
MKLKTLIAAAAAVGALAMASTASAALIFDNVNDAYAIEFDGTADPGGPDADLVANLLLTLTAINSGAFTFTYSLTNNSINDDAGSRISAFGFTVDPNVSGASMTPGGFFANALFDTNPNQNPNLNVPQGLPNVEFCATNNNNCSGGGNDTGTLPVGPTATGSFTLNFDPVPQGNVVAFDNLYVRYISLANGASGVGVPCVGASCGGGFNEVPEPGTWALMILGFGGAGAMIRRRRYAVA